MFGAIFRYKDIAIFGFLQRAAFDPSKLLEAYRFLLASFTVLTSCHLSYFAITWSQNDRGRLAIGDGNKGVIFK
jgi:hypothetical protein